MAIKLLNIYRIIFTDLLDNGEKVIVIQNKAKYDRIISGFKFDESVGLKRINSISQMTSLGRWKDTFVREEED